MTGTDDCDPALGTSFTRETWVMYNDAVSSGMARFENVIFSSLYRAQ